MNKFVGALEGQVGVGQACWQIKPKVPDLPADLVGWGGSQNLLLGLHFSLLVTHIITAGGGSERRMQFSSVTSLPHLPLFTPSSPSCSLALLDFRPNTRPRGS